MGKALKANEQTSYAEFISSARAEAGMTQEEFAHAIGATVSSVNRWERGHIKPSNLARKAVTHFLEELRAAKERQGQN
ncbi:MAG: helix-turn-helix transcriptional regulator [Patescibacteria group bacterium]